MQKIGLALGGGSARGVAHIGVIKALNEANIPIYCVSGTSAGAIIGGVYTAGDLNRLEKELKKMTWQNTLRYFDLAISKNGLFNGQKIHKFIESFFQQKTFQGLKIKFCAVTTEIKTGKEVPITTGKIINAIRASMAIPGLPTWSFPWWLLVPSGNIPIAAPLFSACSTCWSNPLISLGVLWLGTIKVFAQRSRAPNTG